MKLFEEPKKLAIIGTAGRGSDAEKLTLAHWYKMLETARCVCQVNEFSDLVSGGAAWSDHVAVYLAVNVIAGSKLSLHLPGLARDIKAARNYHKTFRQVVGFDTLTHLECALRQPYVTSVTSGGFKQRNTRVATEGTHYLAMTFGDGPKLKDGGTLDTVTKMRSMGKTGWHLDLHDFTLYEHPRP